MAANQAMVLNHAPFSSVPILRKAGVPCKPPAAANMVPPNRAEGTLHTGAEADVWSTWKLSRAKPLWSQAIKSISSFQYYQL